MSYAPMCGLPCRMIVAMRDQFDTADASQPRCGQCVLPGLPEAGSTRRLAVPPPVSVGRQPGNSVADRIGVDFGSSEAARLYALGFAAAEAVSVCPRPLAIGVAVLAPGRRSRGSDFGVCGTKDSSARPGYGAVVGASSEAKAKRRAATEKVGAYHEARLAEVQDHVRKALAAFDAGELDAFEVDAVIHQYTRAARELWKTCVMPGNVEGVASMLDDLASRGETIDWWDADARRRRR